MVVARGWKWYYLQPVLGTAVLGLQLLDKLTDQNEAWQMELFGYCAKGQDIQWNVWYLVIDILFNQISESSLTMSLSQTDVSR